MDTPIPDHLQDITYRSPQIKDWILDDNVAAAKPRALGARQLPEPTTNAGLLDALAIELLHYVVSQLDLLTLSNLRLVNRRCRDIVDALPQLRDLAQHAPNALCGLVAIRASCYVTLERLHRALCTAECELCGDFGGYLYLLAPARVCYNCVFFTRGLLPLRVSHARHRFGLPLEVVKRLPKMRCVRGSYSSWGNKVAPTTLVDYNSALAAGISHHGSVELMQQYVSDMEEAQSRESHPRRRRPPPTSDASDRGEGLPFRYLAISCVPWLDKATQQVERGFHCAECKKSDYKDLILNWRRKFTVASFAVHLIECGNIPDGKYPLWR